MTDLKQTNKERLAVMETKLDAIKEEVSSFKADMHRDIQEIKEGIKIHIQWEENKYDQLKKEFAAKWTEKLSWGILVILLGLVIKLIVG